MDVRSPQPSSKGNADKFTGDVWSDVIIAGEPPSRLRVYVVHFAPGAHTAWHSHANGQTLHVTEGKGLVQSRGGDVIEVRGGDTIYTPPGEWHWHGAAPGHFMTHLAVYESLAVGQMGPDIIWGDPISEEQYRTRAEHAYSVTSGAGRRRLVPG